MDFNKIVGICGTIKRVAHQTLDKQIDEKDAERIIIALIKQIDDTKT
jgi:hypothetical protein